MKRYQKFMVGAIGAAAVSLPFAVGNVAFGQEQFERPTAVAPQAIEAPSAETATDETVAAPQAVVADKAETDKKAAIEDKVDGSRAIVVEEKAAAAADEQQPAIAAETPSAVEAKKETVTEDKVAAPQAPVAEEQTAAVAEEAQPAAVAETEAKTVTEDNVEQPQATIGQEQTADVAEETQPAVVSETSAKVETETAAATAETVETPQEVVTDEKPVAPVKRNAEEIAFALQTELKRVGCYFGAPDGVWGRRSALALHTFSRFGKVEHDDYEPSEAWIAHVKAQTKTVCHGSYYGYAHPYKRRDYGHGYDGPSPYGYRGGYRRGYHGGGYHRY